MSAEAAGLRERLEALLAEARAAGALAELRPLLADALTEDARGADAPDAPPAAGDDVPIPSRFGMIGDSPAMQAVFDLIAKIARSDVPVLVQGETGTGKELVARALHEQSNRQGKPFLAENCAAVPAQLLESELFGHKRGSFTGAVSDRQGHFVAADGGTVFLDEIGDMPLEMQAKLLRVLQEGEVRPVGSNKTVKVDVRIVAATNKDLWAMCGQGTFREDLYFRLNVVALHLPPLRERGDDVVHLVRYFVRSAAREMGLAPERVPVLTPEALEALKRWRWPGNVRELENEIRRALALADGAIGPQDLSPQLGGTV